MSLMNLYGKKKIQYRGKINFGNIDINRKFFIEKNLIKSSQTFMSVVIT